jgi:hypothetical protein
MHRLERGVGIAGELTARTAVGQRLQSTPPIFLIRVSEGKINIVKNPQNLRFECAQSNR